MLNDCVGLGPLPSPLPKGSQAHPCPGVTSIAGARVAPGVPSPHPRMHACALKRAREWCEPSARSVRFALPVG